MKRLIVTSLCVLMILLTAPALAITRTWDGGIGGDWFTTTNWDPNGSPADSDNLFINTGSTTTASAVLTSNGGAITFNSGTAGSFGGLYPGSNGNGTLNITGGADVTSGYSDIALNAGSTGTATVDGSGSTWDITISVLHVGDSGNGTLNITGGGEVTCTGGYIGTNSASTSTATVDGAGSTWRNTGTSILYVGLNGTGTLNITDGGLVSVALSLTIDFDLDGDSFINMATGGMLALSGDADSSLTDFLNLIGGTGAIRYWDYSTSNWADINGATLGVDYTLDYLTAGDLAGYTMLTVTAVPEPATIVLLGFGSLLLSRSRKFNKK